MGREVEIGEASKESVVLPGYASLRRGVSCLVTQSTNQLLNIIFFVELTTSLNTHPRSIFINSKHSVHKSVSLYLFLFVYPPIKCACHPVG